MTHSSTGCTRKHSFIHALPADSAPEEWLDPDTPVSGGTLTARVVVPEIDGGMLPLCIATQTKTNKDTICTPLKMNG